MRKTLPFLLLVASTSIAPVSLLASRAIAQEQNPAAADKLSDADMEELLAPVALYPDRLLANVLTAACYPDELAAAQKAGGDKAAIEAASWEPSVKAVAQIP